MGVGKDYQKRNSSFIKIEDGESAEGIFGGMKPIVKDVFGQEKEVMRYKIDNKTFDSSSGALAIQMDEVTVGEKIRISREGTGMETKYTVERLDKATQENWEAA